MVQDGAEKDHLLSRHVSRHGNHRHLRYDSGHRLCFRGVHYRLDVADRRRQFQLDAVDLRCCLQAWVDHCHLDVEDHYRRVVEVRCRLLDVVDRRDAGVRLDVMNCLDLGERSWKAESAGDRGH